MKPDNGSIFSNAKSYEDYVGRWSRLVARKFISWLDIAPERVWLDVGAGTGTLTQVILQSTSAAKIVGIDLSEDYTAYARQHVRDERVEFRVGDALSQNVDQADFDVAVAGLVLNFLSSPQEAVKSMVQALKAGGTAGAYVWDYSGQMEMMRHFWDAAIKVDPTAREMDAGQRFTICNPDNLRALFQSVGLEATEATAIDIETEFENFDDYWLPFLGAQGSVSKYLRGLSDETRIALREQLKLQLPTADDGRINLMARAWAVKGQRSH
ncbi:MAG: class I SAM-dependent methyltransferase [Anaerolineae bacterium]